MSDFHFLDVLPIEATFISIIVILMISAWMGTIFVRWRKIHLIVSDNSHLNTIVTANLALLAFILAFTFGLATTRYDARKLYFLEEINAIETVWLRTALIEEPHRREIRDLLKEYVRIRVETANKAELIMDANKKAIIIQDKIWEIVTKWIGEAPHDPVNALFITSINNMFDSQTKRVTVFSTYRIPPLIWIALFVLIIFSMFAVGYLFGKMSVTEWYMIVALSLAFSSVILVIIDLDSVKGFISIDYQPIFDLYERIK